MNSHMKSPHAMFVLLSFILFSPSLWSACTQNALQCASSDPRNPMLGLDTVQLCRSNGQWQNVQTCAYGCSNGQCQVCKPNDQQCSISNPNVRQVCNANGQWTNAENCTAGCSQSGPRGASHLYSATCLNCVDDSRRCAPSGAARVQWCGGGKWIDLVNCSSTCSNGVCATPLNQCSPDGKSALTYNSVGELVNREVCNASRCSLGRDCATGCANGYCNACTAGQTYCSQGVQYACTNGQFIQTISCSYGCAGLGIRDATGVTFGINDRCRTPSDSMGNCTEGKTRCSSSSAQTIEQCVGGGWTPVSSCASPGVISNCSGMPYCLLPAVASNNTSSYGSSGNASANSYVPGPTILCGWHNMTSVSSDAVLQSASCLSRMLFSLTIMHDCFIQTSPSVLVCAGSCPPSMQCISNATACICMSSASASTSAVSNNRSSSAPSPASGNNSSASNPVGSNNNGPASNSVVSGNNSSASTSASSGNGGSAQQPSVSGNNSSAAGAGAGGNPPSSGASDNNGPRHDIRYWYD